MSKFGIDKEEVQKMKDGICPANTLNNNKWAMCTFETWQTRRNKDNQCPDNNKNIDCELLHNFVAEVCKNKKPVNTHLIGGIAKVHNKVTSKGGDCYF